MHEHTVTARRPAPPRGRAALAAGVLILTGLVALAPVGRTDALAQQPARTERPRRVSINFAGVEVRQALSSIAEYTRTDIAITPGATGQISISLRDRDADEAIRLVAAAAGLSVLKVGSSYLVGPPTEVRKAAAELGRSEVVSLRHLKPEDARDLLARIAPAVNVEVAPGAIVLSGLGEEVDAARAAITALDRPAPALPPVPEPSETDVYTLRHVESGPVQRVLREAFPGLKVSVNEKVMILSGPRSELAAAGRALRELDVAPPAPPAPAPMPDPVEHLVYKLEFLNANSAETALKGALPDLKVAVGAEPVAPPPAAFVPLSLSLLGGGSGGSGFGGAGIGGGGGGGGLGAGGGGAGAGGAGQGGLSGGTNEQKLDRSTRLILIGKQSEVKAAVNLLKQMDVPAPRVNIEAEVVEVDSRDFKDLGIRWIFDDPAGPSLNIPFVIPPGRDINIGRLLREESGFRVSLNGLITQNKARVLARPNIAATDNEDANVFIGDLLRFRGINVVTPDVGTVQGTDTIPVGIALLVRPRIHPDNTVTLKVHPVVSSVSGVVDGLPQTTSREADTTVRLKVGESLIIGGLRREDYLDEIRKVPLLGDLPLLGQLFRARNRSKRQNEIVIIIRVREVEQAPYLSKEADDVRPKR